MAGKLLASAAIYQLLRTCHDGTNRNIDNNISVLVQSLADAAPAACQHISDTAA